MVLGSDQLIVIRKSVIAGREAQFSPKRAVMSSFSMRNQGHPSSNQARNPGEDTLTIVKPDSIESDEIT